MRTLGSQFRHGFQPLIGLITDALVAGGAQVIFGETMEWLGAEHLLARRAATPEVAQALVQAVSRREALAMSQGEDLLGNNPGPTNIAAGLSTIEEKSLGAIAKSGSATIQGVLALAERPVGPGLYAMDASAYAPESLSGFVAAGAQMLLFYRRGQQLCQSVIADRQNLCQSASLPGAAAAAGL